MLEQSLTRNDYLEAGISTPTCCWTTMTRTDVARYQVSLLPHYACHISLCLTAEVSTVSHSKHACCVTPQTCLLSHAADINAAWQDQHASCIAQWRRRLGPQHTRLLRDAADTLAVSHSRPAWHGTQQRCPLCGAAGRSAVRTASMSAVSCGLLGFSGSAATGGRRTPATAAAAASTSNPTAAAVLVRSIQSRLNLLLQC